MTSARFQFLAFLLAALLSWPVLQLNAVEIFPTNAEWRWQKGTAEASSPDPSAWRQLDFDDAGWASGPAPIAYGEPTVTPGTELVDMRGNYTSVYLRRKFTIANPGDLEALTLRAASDDGFIAWINGREVARFNLPAGELAFDANALAPAPDPPPIEDYPIANPGDVIQAGDNVIAIHGFNVSLSGSSDFVFLASLEAQLDETAPTVTRIIPAPGAVLRELVSVEVNFSERVRGVDATDLQMNGVPATAVTEFAPGQFEFTFPKPGAGPVTLEWIAGHGITDTAGTAHPFAGGSWSYTIDPNAPLPGLTISEFMADNEHGIRDDDGDREDWIELHNGGATAVNLSGWFLTDNPDNLSKWRFPSMTLAADRHLLVWASEKNRINPAAPLHTNFKLSSDGEFLALVSPAGEIVSVFSPTYPPQREDVSFGRASGAPNVVGYFPVPTPGADNLTSGPGFAPDVVFAIPSRTFTNAFSLSLALATPAAEAVIRFTIDGGLPDEGSPIYSTALTITNTLQVRARAFQPGLLPGNPRSETYLYLAATQSRTQSDLPYMILHNFGGGRPPANADQFAFMALFAPSNGVASMSAAPTVTSRAAISARGSSTEGYAKVSMKLELRDEFDRDRDLSLLGLPADSDWVLYAPNNFDPVLINNAFAHALSRSIGRYSPRTRFVEVYLVSGGNGQVSTPYYNGIYILEEKIKVGAHRVDIDRLSETETNAVAVTGGYLMKIDRPDPGDSGFGVPGNQVMYVDPKEEEITTPERAPQQSYLQGYMNSFGNSFYAANWKDPVNGYARYLDVDAAIDHHLLNVLTFNVDAMRLSGYFYKPRGGKVTFGPLWDFDRALGSTDGRDFNPRVWRSQVSDRGTDFFNYPWWDRMFLDPDFYQRYIDRFLELRRGAFAPAALQALADQLANEVRKAQPRELVKWGVQPRRADGNCCGSYDTEVQWVKRWLSNRVEFMNSQFVRPPVLSAADGPINPGFQVTATGPAAATLYYTLDGSDPRASGGGIAPGAKTYSDALTLNGNARVVVRSYNPNHTAITGPDNPPLKSLWSGAAAATYFTTIPPLTITEIMFHPTVAPGSTNTESDLEFVELKNVGTAPLSLAGFRFTNGIDFTFTAGAGVISLPADGRVVVAKNRAAFLKRYPGTPNVVGDYLGSLANEGERLTLIGPLWEPVFDFSYGDHWAPLADGFGFSLVLADEATPLDQLGDSKHWRLSSIPGGSPSSIDPAPPAIPPIRVNEALTHPGPGQRAAIELYNPTAEPADISGWWLTDEFGEPKKFRLPANSKLDGHGFLVVDESEFHAEPANGFALSLHGEDVYLFSADAAGELTGWFHGFDFGPAESGVSFGRFTTSDGREHFPPQVSVTLGAVNSAPRIGPVVLSEIHYWPPPDGTNNNTLDEFIELRNLTGQPVSLFDPAHATNTWRIRGGVNFDFPAGATFAANSYLLLVSFDPQAQPVTLSAFRTRFNLVNGVPVFGPWQGVLNNDGDTVTLLKPDAPDAGTVPFVLIDQVHYEPAPPWPTNGLAAGSSLQRLVGTAFADDPANWRTAAPTAGVSNGAEPNGDRDGDGLPDDWETRFGLNPDSAAGEDGASGDPDHDGFTNAQELVAGTEPNSAASALRLTVSREAGGAVLLHFQAAAGHGYTVSARDSLFDGSWEVLTTIPPDPNATEVTVPDPTSKGARFYRVQTP